MFFYNPALDRDIQFRRVVQAMFESPGRAGDDKAPWLARLKAEGIYYRFGPLPCDNHKVSAGDRRAPG